MAAPPGSLAVSDYAPAVQRTAYHIMQLLEPPIVFTRKWFTKIHSRVSRWSEWHGDLRLHVFEWESKEFEQEMMDIINDYCKQPERWERIKKCFKWVKEDQDAQFDIKNANANSLR